MSKFRASPRHSEEGVDAPDEHRDDACVDPVSPVRAEPRVPARHDYCEPLAEQTGAEQTASDCKHPWGMTRDRAV